MLPIFRQLDGENTKEKNAETFDKCSKRLRKKGNILIFGEGFTDDVPMRSLKPVKKGALRIGFEALKAMDWKYPVYVSALGVTYTDRNAVGSEFVIKNGATFCLNDYKTEFLEAPNKTIVQLTRILEKNMQDCIVYVAKKEWFNFFELVMQFSRRGIHHQQFDERYSLLERFEYANRLAHWVNEQALEPNEEIVALRDEMDSYSALLKRAKLTDRQIYLKGQKGHVWNDYLKLTLWFPLALIGFLHGIIPYLLAKFITEKLFRRKVFWGSVKVLLGIILGSALFIPLLCTFSSVLFKSATYLGVVYYFCIPLICRISYKWFELLRSINEKRKLGRIDLQKISAKREAIIEKLNRFIPSFM